MNYVIPEALPPLLVGSALASSGSILEPSGTGAMGHRGSFQQLLTEAPPCSPLLPKPCHANQIHSKMNITGWVYCICIYVIWKSHYSEVPVAD